MNNSGCAVADSADGFDIDRGRRVGLDFLSKDADLLIQSAGVGEVILPPAEVEESVAADGSSLVGVEKF